MNELRNTYLNKSPEGLHYVLWSGGCDSTLLLYELLETFGSKNVIAISYNYPWLSQHKVEAERRSQQLFKDKMNDRDKMFQGFRHMEINVSSKMITGDTVYPRGGGRPQSVAWLLSIPLYTCNTSYIYDGTNMGDDLVILLEHYWRIFKDVSKVLERQITLRQPYLAFSKNRIIEKLIEYDLYDTTWFCEMPESSEEICGKCKPCKTHVAALASMPILSDNPIVREKSEIILNNIKPKLK